MTGNPKNLARSIAEFQRKRIVDLMGIAQEKRQALTRLEELNRALRAQGHLVTEELCTAMGEARVEVEQAQRKVRMALEQQRKESGT